MIVTNVVKHTYLVSIFEISSTGKRSEEADQFIYVEAESSECAKLQAISAIHKWRERLGIPYEFEIEVSPLED